MIVAVLLFVAGHALAPAKITTLPCDGSRFRLESRRWADRQAPRAPNAQFLSIERAGHRQQIALEPTAPTSKNGFPVRDRYVSDWACVTGGAGQAYVVLGYACANSPGEKGDCGGEQEWYRLLDTRGRPVDRGVPHNGRRAVALQRRLGLAAQFANGIQMHDAIGED